MWLNPTNITKVKIFWGEAHYLQKFIASFLAMVMPLHSITTNNNGFSGEGINIKSLRISSERSIKHQFLHYLT